MAECVHEVARYTKTHIRNNVLLSGNPLVPEVRDTATFTVYTYCSDNINITMMILVFASPSYSIHFGINIVYFDFNLHNNAVTTSYVA
jgi:hypothetical protein